MIKKILGDNLRADFQPAAFQLNLEKNSVYDLFMQTPAAIAIVEGENHIFVFTNPLFLQLVGKKDNLIGRAVREVFPELEGQGFFELMTKVYETGEPFTGKEVPVQWDADGDGQTETSYLNFIYQPLFDENGRVQGIMTQGVDITEQVIARHRAENAEKQLQSLANNMPQLVWMARADGYIYWYNFQWYKYTGTTPQDMQGWGWQAVHDPIVLPQVMERWQNSIEKGENFEMIFPLKGADNIFRPFLTRITPIRNDLGEVTQWFGTNTEISEQIKIENALKRSEHRLKALYEADIIGVVYCNAEGWIFDANDAFLKIIGFSREDLENGKINWAYLTPPEYRAADEKALLQLETNGVAEPWEKEYITKEGSRVPVILGGASLEKDTADIIAFVIDITERKRIEQRKDDFIGLASHELKTPLTSIKGYLQLLERIIDKTGDDKAKLYISRTTGNVDKLTNLISELLDVSKIQAGKMQIDSIEFGLHGLLKDTVESYQLMTASHTIILSQLDQVQVVGDMHRLEQVITNLLSNAIKYSPGAEKIEVSLLNQGNFARVAIRDYGVGIALSEQAKIFEKFYRVEEHSWQFSGLGIGLYISSEIISRHGGRLWVESTENAGSTFYFTLPVKD